MYKRAPQSAVCEKGKSHITNRFERCILKFVYFVAVKYNIHSGHRYIVAIESICLALYRGLHGRYPHQAKQ